MARSLTAHIRSRRMQRWLRREALLLAREAEMFDCIAAQHEAEQLVKITHSSEKLYVLRSA